MEIPDDIMVQCDNPTQSPLDKKKDEKKQGKEARDCDEHILEELYQRNKKDPRRFAGVMNALHAFEADDALKLLYRQRARELLVSIKEKENQRREYAPSYQSTWNIGDKILGKGGLELVPSMMTTGKPIPGLTTYKRKLDPVQGTGRLKAIPDLFLIIDSSGSMGWNPWHENPDSRGDFDKAILAAEAAALYALDEGGSVAAINFSGNTNVIQQSFTTSISKIEDVLMKHYGGGTHVPVKQIYTLIRKTTNPLLTCLMSDCWVDNEHDAYHKALQYCITEHDSLSVFLIGGSSQRKLIDNLRLGSALIYPVNKITDLYGLIIGEVKKLYKGDSDAD